MSDIHVHVKGLASGQVRAGSTAGEALEGLATGVASEALAAKVGGQDVDLAFRLEPPERQGDVVEIEPILPDTLDGLGVLRHSPEHLLAAAGLPPFPSAKLRAGHA